ncbi:MAG: PAS domain S-box protein [Bacteroidales bacterium]|nr:PAS domain S-box protein [Bacteroidales bacterium]
MIESSNHSSFEFIFQHSPIPLWKIDYTEMFAYFNTLRDVGIENLKQYFIENPAEFSFCIDTSKIIHVNNKVLELYEIDSIQELKIDKSRFFSEKSQAIFVQQIDHFYKGNITFSADTEIITKSNTLKHIRLKSNLIKKDEKVIAIVSTEDIREQKLQEKQFKEAITASPDSITMNRISDGVFVFANETFKKTFGYSDEDILDKSAFELGMWVNVKDRESYFKELKEKGFIQDLATTFQSKSGKILDVLLSAKTITYNNEPHLIVTTKDVSKLNTLTLSLRQSEEQFRKAFMNIPDAFQINKISTGEFIDVNDYFIKYTGYTREELIGKSPEDLNIWMDGVTNRNFYRQLLRKGHISNFETTFRMKDGSILQSFISANIIKLNGEPHIITVTKDISKFKSTQEKLKRSEEKFQSIFSNSPDALAIMEMTNWTFVEVNEMFTKITGLLYEEIIGKSTFDLNLWSRKSDRIYITSKAQNQEEFNNYKSLFTLSNGEQIHMLVSAKLIDISGEKFYLLIAKNVDDFINIQKELFEKENRYKAIVSNSYEGIAIIDHAFHFDYTNQQFEIITGYTSEELLGLDFREILTQESAVRVGESYLARQAGKDIPQNYTFEIIRKNGEIRIVEIHASVIKTAEGKPQTIAQLLDVTEREKAAKILAKEHQRTLQYFEVAGMVMLVLDMNGIITAINKKGCEVLEAEEKEIVGKNWFTHFVPKNISEKLQTQLTTSIQNGDETHPYYENEIKTASGKEKLIAWRNSILRNDKDEVIGILSSGEDISDKDVANRILNMSGLVTILWKNEKDSPIEFVSENAETLFGYQPKEFYSKKINFRQLVHPDDAERLKTETKDFTEQKRSHFIHQPYRIITKSGETKWISDRSSVQLNSEGNITHFFGVLSDISDDIIKGEKLRQSNEILSQMKDGVIITDFSGKISDWSGGAEKIFGYDLEEIVGDNIQRIWDTEIDTKQQLESILNNINTSEYFQNKIYCKHKNGETIPIELTAKILYDSFGSPLSLILVNRDITNREVAQKALEDSEKRYRHIFESILDGVIIYNMNKEIVEVNAMATQMYGYSFQEFTQTETSRFIHPVQNHTFEDVLKHLDNNYTKMFEGESVDLTKSGDKFFVNTKGRLIFYNNEPHLLIIVRDITKIKQAEHDLFKAKEKAIESEQLKSAFLANMSHEIRTPMNSIIGFSDLIGDEDISAEEKQHFLGIIRQNGNQLMAIINDIIDISKIEAGQIQLNYELIDICETFQDIYNMFELTTKDKGIKLIKALDCTGDEFLIKTDELRLKQILINLISNSLKFTHNGFIEFGCNVIDDERTIHFYVKDTGIGISKDKQGEIFHRFMQAEVKTNKLYGGTGLGLAISLGLVNTFKGKIWLESDLGMGSTFNFSIPLIQE